MRHWYSLLLYLLLPWVFLRLILRGLGNPAYFRRWPERFGFVSRRDQGCMVWVHAVSVGETRAAAPLVEALQARYPKCRVHVTTMTPTGSDQVRTLFGTRVGHSYVPYDLPDAVHRFLRLLRPDLAIIMETEFWPNLFHACRRRDIPLLVANLRMSEKSARRYLRFPGLARATFRQVTLFGVQSGADGERVRRIGASGASVRITGSIKFDLELPVSLREVGEVLRREWGQERPVWLAASTHDGEEAQVLQALPGLRRRFPGLLLVMVPRHPERFSEVARLCRKAGYRVTLRSRSEGRPLGEEEDVFIGDTMGELLLFYAACDVAFVGGSLVPTGGHNVLEACASGVPVVFGPHMFNFAEISRLTLEHGAGVEVENAAQLERVVATLLTDPNRRFEMGEAGKAMVEQNRGALSRTLALAEELYKG